VAEYRERMGEQGDSSELTDEIATGKPATVR
jgi:hypothetical protein